MHNWAGLLAASGHLPDPPSIRVDTLVEHPMHHALLSAWRPTLCTEAPHLSMTVSLVLTRLGNGRLDPWCMLRTLSVTAVLLSCYVALSGYGFFNCAPSGMTPCST